VSGTPTVTLPDKPLSAAMDAELARLRTEIPSGKKLYGTLGVNTRGVEVGAAWSPVTHLTLAGYAARLWGSATWEAGARATVTW